MGPILGFFVDFSYAYKKKFKPFFCEKSLGGRDFNEVLFKNFAKKFKVQYEIDVLSNVWASHRFSTSYDKLKKFLSANPRKPLNIECLVDEKYVIWFIKQDEFEQVTQPMPEHVKGPSTYDLIEVQVTIDKIHPIEVVYLGYLFL